jgi:hypothetical protein
VANSQQSVLAAPLITVDADPKRWLDQTLVDLPQERVKEVQVKPAEGPAYTASREKKEQPDFTVSNIPKGRELTNSTAADSIAGSLVSLTLEDAHKANTQQTAAPQTDPKVSHAIFHTFDGLELDVTGRKNSTQPSISIAARSSAKDTEAEAQQLNARLQGWEYEIPSYKYDSIFKPLEDLLKKPEPPKKAEKGKKTEAKAGKKAQPEAKPK